MDLMDRARRNALDWDIVDAASRRPPLALVIRLGLLHRERLEGRASFMLGVAEVLRRERHRSGVEAANVTVMIIPPIRFIGILLLREDGRRLTFVMLAAGLATRDGLGKVPVFRMRGGDDVCNACGEIERVDPFSAGSRVEAGSGAAEVERILQGIPSAIRIAGERLPLHASGG